MNETTKQGKPTTSTPGKKSNEHALLSRLIAESRASKAQELASTTKRFKNLDLEPLAPTYQSQDDVQHVIERFKRLDLEPYKPAPLSADDVTHVTQIAKKFDLKPHKRKPRVASDGNTIQ